jgi:hypothetical protein
MYQDIGRFARCTLDLREHQCVWRRSRAKRGSGVCKLLSMAKASRVTILPSYGRTWQSNTSNLDDASHATARGSAKHTRPVSITGFLSLNCPPLVTCHTNDARRNFRTEASMIFSTTIARVLPLFRNLTVSERRMIILPGGLLTPRTGA